MDSEADSFDMDSGMDEMASIFGETPDEPMDDILDESVDEIKEEVEEEIEEEIEEVEEKIEEEVKKRAAPQSWKKDMHTIWEGMSPEAQDYIELRERQMREGVTARENDAKMGQIMRDVMAPYSNMLKGAGVDEPTMVKNLMNAHYLLSTSPPEQKANLIKQLANGYGVNLSGEQAKDENPDVIALRNDINTLKSTLNQRDQAFLQEQRSQIASEVSAFAEDHPHFDEVADEMAVFISQGLNLEDAYDRAVWANPVVRQQELERLNAENAQKLKEKAQKEADEAKKAKSANVRSRHTKKAHTAPTGTMDDTMAEVFKEIQQRN